MKRILKPGGRVSMVVYRDHGEPEFSQAVSTVRQLMGLEGSVPPAISLGTAEGLEGTFTGAGFYEVEVHELMLPVQMSSAAECVHYLQDTSPTLRELLLPLSPEARADAWQVVEKTLSVFENSTGFEVYHRVLVAAGGMP
jgi:hypothetical protein